MGDSLRGRLLDLSEEVGELYRTVDVYREQVMDHKNNVDDMREEISEIHEDMREEIAEIHKMIVDFNRAVIEVQEQLDELRSK